MRNCAREKKMCFGNGFMVGLPQGCGFRIAAMRLFLWEMAGFEDMERIYFLSRENADNMFGLQFSTIMLILGIQFISGIIKAVAGFGNGPISGSVLAMRFDVAEVTASNGLLDLLINSYYALKFRKAYRVRKYILLSAVVAAGGIAGAFLLKVSPPSYLKILVGCFVIFLGIRMIVRKETEKEQNPWLRRAILFLGGVTGGIFGMNVFFIPMFKRMSKSYEEFKGGVCFTYALDLFIRMPIYFLTGTVTEKILPILGFSIVGLLVGIFVGNILAKYIQPKTAELITILLMFVAGLSVIFKTVFWEL